MTTENIKYLIIGELVAIDAILVGLLVAISL